ncbi:MAG: response regulator, partial [Firmicutes bacterium]|nr:response regulator [Bacillota bacterium]
MRLLVVEDEQRLADTLADILQNQKYLVDVCYDGESGLDNAMSGIYDAIIMDVMMPKMNG